MEITLLQALLLALVSGLCFAGVLLGLFTNRVIVLSFFVGLILGDVKTGLMMGAIGELAFMGFGVGAGGTVPPNPLGPGIVGTIMAITLKNQGITPESALALSYPFAVLFQLMQTFIYTLFAASPEAARRAIDKGNYKLFKFHANVTVLGFFVAGFIIALISALAMEPLRTFVELIPQSLIAGLTVAGGLLPAIGFAMILSVMISRDVIPYILLGYIAIAYLELPVMAIALLGAVFALIDYFQQEKNEELAMTQTNSFSEEDQYGI
ncbi:MAG TPA: PTS sugar transporter subunit IIC [Candidatus Jeotgalibaca pullicola]|nr:PTS sugar transporter subunit IIC [Candidatus Jeotgalibaca pullicola]